MAENKQYDEVQQNFWTPVNIGDSVCGIYKGMLTNVGENKSNVYKIRQENGEMIFIWATAVIDTKIQLIFEGDDIKIVYQGEKVTTKGKRTYKDFQVLKAKISQIAGDSSEPFFTE